MRIHVPKNWELKESVVTPEASYRGRTRREFLRTAGLGLAGGVLLNTSTEAASGGFPTAVNPKYSGADLKITPLDQVTSYNNFYEFGMDKGDPKDNANAGWKPEPWAVEITGLCGNPGKWDVEDLLKKVGGIEQRVYRFRCVEAWSMVIPWDGFALASLVKFAQPKPEAHFLKFTSFFDPKHASGQRDNGSFPWPYVEGLEIHEATNELAFIATGLYGKTLPNQNGAPLRLVTPWKYGFKGIKSIVKIEFVAKVPRNTWQVLAPSEYGFMANVNPLHDHPRWSQASERVIGGGFFAGRQKTLMFNGYEQQVAGLYKGIDLDKYF
jgi:sulfoxide reductase catalytic subunit YedY